MSISAETREKRASKGRWIGWLPTTTLSCMAAAFLIALALAVIVLVIFGVGERGTAIALRATARWSFLLVLVRLCWGRDCMAVQAAFCRIGAPRARTGPRLRFGATRSCRARPLDHSHRDWSDRRHGVLLGRDILHLSPRALLRAAASRRTRAASLADIPHDCAGIHRHSPSPPILSPCTRPSSEAPLSYLPFALMLVSGAGLRVVAFSDRKRSSARKPSFESPRSAQGLSIRPNVSRRSPSRLARVDVRWRYCGSVGP